MTDDGTPRRGPRGVPVVPVVLIGLLILAAVAVAVLLPALGAPTRVAAGLGAVAGVVVLVLLFKRRGRAGSAAEGTRDVTDIHAGGVEKYVSFMGRSIPREQARLLAERVLAHIRFHTAYLPYEPVPARIQFVLPSGAMFIMQDGLEHGSRRLDLIYAQGFAQFPSMNTFRRSSKEDQAAPWFSGPMSQREVDRVLLRLQGVIDTAHNSGRAVREPDLPLVDPTAEPTRVVGSA